MLALVDAQLRLSINGKLRVDIVYDPTGLDCHPASRPLGIGTAGPGLTLAELNVLRDVYYLARGETGGSLPQRLGVDEYWLLGDNSASSVDSRSWPPARGNLFVGRVLIHGK